MNPTTKVSQEVVAERNAQDTRWGEQNHPDHHPNVAMGLQSVRFIYDIPSEALAKDSCEHRRTLGIMSWADILNEEFVEALHAETTEDLRAELIQVAAVAQAWVECIDRRES